VEYLDSRRRSSSALGILRTTLEKLRRIAGAICSLYGTSLVIFGLWVVRFDVMKSTFSMMTATAAVIGLLVLAGGIAALRGSRIWAIPAVVGSGLILAVGWKMSHGRPQVLFASTYSIVGILIILVPAIIGLLAVADLAYRYVHGNDGMPNIG